MGKGMDVKTYQSPEPDSKPNQSITVPSGAIRFKNPFGVVTFVIFTNTVCPAVPLKVSSADCHAVVVVTVTDEPSTPMVPVTGVGAFPRYSCSLPTSFP